VLGKAIKAITGEQIEKKIFGGSSGGGKKELRGRGAGDNLLKSAGRGVLPKEGGGRPSQPRGVSSGQGAEFTKGARRSKYRG